MHFSEDFLIFHNITGNGTLIGASANVVAVGVAEEKGYKITFLQFAKLGMPIMFITVAVSL